MKRFENENVLKFTETAVKHMTWLSPFSVFPSCFLFFNFLTEMKLRLLYIFPQNPDGIVHYLFGTVSA